MCGLTQRWRAAQTSVAAFLKKHRFAVQEEVVLTNGKRIDILAQKKLNREVFHILIEVKDWRNISRRAESQFCKQITDYLVEFALEEKTERGEIINPSQIQSLREKFVGILCLTNDCHFSYRKVSHHFISKHNLILGMPVREKLADYLELYVARFDFMPKVFRDLGIPLYRQKSLTQWLE
ncbi:MAG: hypothetical protein GF308_16460 [Candidatus Heimdallarchaeota archaeon]|nr:hypothetical protein [Candidatus Heimdallarchaeota archaeon]